MACGLEENAWDLCRFMRLVFRKEFMTHFLFDFDGTIGNTMPLCVAAFRDALEPLAHRQIADAEILATFGPSEDGTIRALLPDHFEQGLARYFDSFARLHDQWPEPFPGIRGLLDYVKQTESFLGLVTGRGPRNLAITLTRYGLTDMFQVIKTGRPEGKVKESCIDEIFTAYPLRREDTIYVGDTAYDIQAAHACGIRAVAAAWAPTVDLAQLQAAKPDYCFETVDAFSEAVRNHQL